MSQQKKQPFGPMIIIATLFFIFGFVTWANGSLIPYFKIACELKSDLQSYLVATAFFIAFTVMAIPSSIVLRKVGYKKGMSIGLFTMALGAMLFLPAATIRSFNLFLTGLFIIGTGIALLQTAANPYATVIGPIESAATRISIMGICNKVAGILAGLVLGSIILSDTDGIEARLQAMDEVSRNAALDELASKVILPYITLAIILVIVGIVILFSSLPDIKDEDEKSPDTNNTTVTKTSVFQFPHLLLGVLALFLYVGVEVIAGDTIISYGKSIGIPLSTAKYFTQMTLAFMLLGYVIGIVAIPKFISQSKALKICAILGVLFTILAVVSSGFTSVFFISLLGLANSLMWPAIFPLAIDGLGKFTKTGSALLIMAISGGAILPLIYGKLSASVGTSDAYLLMVPCYLFILYFATIGYRQGRRN